MKTRIVSNDQTHTVQDATGSSYDYTAGIELRWFQSDYPVSNNSNFSIVHQASLQDVDVILGVEELTRLFLNGNEPTRIRVLTLARLTPGT